MPDQAGRETTANDRSAGRWCEICQQHGSHHTDRHDLFVTAGREATDVKWCGRAPAYRCIYLDEGEAEPCELHAQEGRKASRQTDESERSKVSTHGPDVSAVPDAPVGRQTTCGAPAVGGPCVLPRAHNMGCADIPENHQSGRPNPVALPLVHHRITRSGRIVLCACSKSTSHDDSSPSPPASDL